LHVATYCSSLIHLVVQNFCCTSHLFAYFLPLFQFNSLDGNFRCMSHFSFILSWPPFLIHRTEFSLHISFFASPSSQSNSLIKGFRCMSQLCLLSSLSTSQLMVHSIFPYSSLSPSNSPRKAKVADFVARPIFAYLLPLFLS
jgi:hypothetical protein